MTTRAEFGISITPDWSKQEEILDLTRAADDAGLDLIGIQDHPYQWRFHDTWTLIAFLAGKTSQISFFPDVANLPLRPPAILAKAAASLDVLTGGRVELGLGAAGFWDAIEAAGGSRRTPAEAVEAAEEAVDLIRLVWSGERGGAFRWPVLQALGPPHRSEARARHRYLARRRTTADAGSHRTEGRRLGAVVTVGASRCPARIPASDR